ncbi:uncharacterized protein LOC134839294 [Symsagittifera roscoffensis]|uniref:uncharacterized protein LOC134839294 n=1 Tax=Symsagittifera roscoffensis TaxID=84072 RepID=UPI00307C2F48
MEKRESSSVAVDGNDVGGVSLMSRLSAAGQLDSVVGTMHIVSITLNTISLLLLPRVSRVTSSEIVILMGTLLFLCVGGDILLVLHSFSLLSGTESSNFVAMSCLHVPIFYNLFLPAILAKGASLLGGRSKASLCLCDCSYTLLSLGCLVHVVMLLSPMKAFDYHRFESRTIVQSPSADGRMSHSVSLPHLRLVGSIPQTISILLSSKILSEVGKFRKVLLGKSGDSSILPNPVKSPQSQSDNSRTNSSSPSQSQTAFSDGGRRYMANYLYRWGIVSLLLVIPSCLISQFAFVSSQYGKGGDKDNNSQKVPPSLLYIQGVVDSLLFLTQPLCLLITWFSIDTKAMKGHTSASSSQINRPHLVNVAVMDHNQQPLMNSCVQQQHQNGTVVHIPLIARRSTLSLPPLNQLTSSYPLLSSPPNSSPGSSILETTSPPITVPNANGVNSISGISAERFQSQV